jgi:LPXTG-site transpeptidase (sortase) family protein
MGGVLLIAAVAIASYGLVQIREQDASFKAGQETAAEMWVVDPESVPDLEVDTPIPDDPAAPDGGVLIGQPLEVQEEAAAPVRPPFAKLRFVRKGTDESIVTDRVLYVGPDVTDRGLAAGPGHYPGTAKPGKKGNIAIAGHRTGWGSPFLHLEDLQPGDRIKLTDRKGVRHTYLVDSSTLVDPSADWVLGEDPLGTGEPTLTLTTCDPPSVNTERLIVFATLKKSVPRGSSA